MSKKIDIRNCTLLPLIWPGLMQLLAINASGLGYVLTWSTNLSVTGVSLPACTFTGNTNSVVMTAITAALLEEIYRQKVKRVIRLENQLSYLQVTVTWYKIIHCWKTSFSLGFSKQIKYAIT